MVQFRNHKVYSVIILITLTTSSLQNP